MAAYKKILKPFFDLIECLTGRGVSLYSTFINKLARYAQSNSHAHNLNKLQNRADRLHPYIKEAFELVASLIPDKKSEKSFHTSSSFSLEGLFTKYGSDKEKRHSYAAIYADLLNGFSSPRILEIGLGSFNGFPYGGSPPGVSLNAWREAYPNATIIGADIDPDSVEAATETAFVVDQTSEASLKKLRNILQTYAPFDLIVDDGFHDVHANLRTFLTLFPLLSEHGSYVIEDVHETLIDMWKVISLALDAEFNLLDLRSERVGIDDNILIIFKKSKN
jgi:hypothetical protein